MNISPSVLEIECDYGLKHNDEMSPIAIGLAALTTLTCFVLASSLRRRKVGDFPIVGRYEDLYGGLVEGTKLV